MIPPMLRYLHIQDISPSGWVEFNKYTEMSSKSTTCNYEYMVSYKDLISLPNKETTVPYKICSFDIGFKFSWRFSRSNQELQEGCL